MDRLNQTSRRVIILTLALILSFVLGFQALQAQQEWDYYKLPGGVHHKTVFVNRTSGSNQVQALLSVCMSDSLCIKKYESSSWQSWVQAGFMSTWGLDWANIGDYAYVVVGGKEEDFKVLRYYSGNWVDVTPVNMAENLDWWMQECVFYDDGEELDYDNVLACKTQVSDAEFGLFYWDGEDWDEIEYSTPTTESFGYRMWRCLADEEVVYMKHATPEVNDKKIWWINVPSAITSGFSPTEIINPASTEVHQAPAFYQWDDNGDIHQYIIASTTYNSNTSIDVWHREYDSGWEDWEKIVEDVQDDMEEIADENNYIDAEVAIAARVYTDGSTYHRVYISSGYYGLQAYDTQAGTQTCVDLNNVSVDNNRLHVYGARYLAMSPIGEIEEDTDVIIYNGWKSVPHKGVFEWEEGNNTSIDWDSDFFSR